MPFLLYPAQHCTLAPIMGLCVFLLPIPQLQFEPQTIQFLHRFSTPITHNYYGIFSLDYHQTKYWRCFSGRRSGGSRWDWEKHVNTKHKSRFSNGYATDDSDEEEPEFGFRKAAKQRVWWYDEFDAEEDEEEEDDGFGILEAAVGFNWVSKVFQAFGWMIPAVVTSLLMGTGPHTIIMALAVPLAQSAFSLATDTLFGRANETPRRKPWRKKKPFRGDADRTKVRREKKMRTERGKEAGNYKSWMDPNNASAKSRASNPDFGGWDELDNQMRVDKNTRVRNVDESTEEEAVRVSRQTKGDAPLFKRPLAAMLPFLGFCSRLF